MRTKTEVSRQKLRPRQIIGFSLPPDLAVEVKTEAARRNIRLRELFGEMWELYKKKKTA
jgi:hypothetical protein